MSARARTPAPSSAPRGKPNGQGFFDRFITDYSEPRNKPSTVESNRGYGKRYVIPNSATSKCRPLPAPTSLI